MPHPNPNVLLGQLLATGWIVYLREDLFPQGRAQLPPNAPKSWEKLCRSCTHLGCGGKFLTFCFSHQIERSSDGRTHFEVDVDVTQMMCLLNYDDAYLANHGTYDHKPRIRSVVLIEEDTPDMGFVVVLAVVSEIRADEVGAVVFGLPTPSATRCRGMAK